jgi:hypothetical protein
MEDLHNQSITRGRHSAEHILSLETAAERSLRRSAIQALQTQLRPLRHPRILRQGPHHESTVGSSAESLMMLHSSSGHAPLPKPPLSLSRPQRSPSPSLPDCHPHCRCPSFAHALHFFSVQAPSDLYYSREIANHGTGPLHHRHRYIPPQVT